MVQGKKGIDGRRDYFLCSHTLCLWSIPKRLFRPNTSDGRGRRSWAPRNLQHRFRLDLLDRCKKDLEEVEKT